MPSRRAIQRGALAFGPGHAIIPFLSRNIALRQDIGIRPHLHSEGKDRLLGDSAPNGNALEHPLEDEVVDWDQSIPIGAAQQP